ncbi:hypothetical protein [Streptomyces sp. NPDC051546]|uniref:hypothetical protein n=1 Tax=Streptomyces sp. NPDC051546 TaxID=3365655 RepID=UPI0037883E87
MPLGSAGAPARAAVYGCVALSLGGGLTGCSAGEGARDYGPAPTVSAPAAVSKLWPDRAEAAGHERVDTSGDARSPVPGIVVPAEGVRGLDPAAVLTADPATRAWVKAGLEECPDSGCRLRAPEYADLTGDGHPGLVLAYDGPGRTLMWVYVVEGQRLRRVLGYAGQPGLTAETRGRDLVVLQRQGIDRVAATFRWDGSRLAPVVGAGATTGSP